MFKLALTRRWDLTIGAAFITATVFIKKYRHTSWSLLPAIMTDTRLTTVLEQPAYSLESF